MQSFHLISGLLEHNQSFDDIWSCCTVAWLTSSNTPSLLDWTLCYWSMFIRVFGGSGQVTALSPGCRTTEPRVGVSQLSVHHFFSPGSGSTGHPAGPLRALLNWPRPSPNFLMITMIWINTTITLFSTQRLFKDLYVNFVNLLWFSNAVMLLINLLDVLNNQKIFQKTSCRE